MIKPLLRTIPTMSGNVKLACTLLDYNKIKEDTFETNIRGAHLLPLSSSLFQKSVTANLLNSSWEYDLKKFYAAYSDTFFDTVFPISVLEMPILDETQIFKNRNTDLEYGVKRVSYDKSGCQFACFAPVYIDDPKDIPAYFLLKMDISANRAKTTKYIKVNIGSNAKSNSNYIYKYLNKYLSKIDDNVAYMNNVDHTVTYYGIDLVNGGFTKTIDATVSSLFNIQMPIQMFDNTLSIGFERNRMCMRQSIPLCFYFNVQDVLNSVELEKFKFGSVVFSGNYYDSNDNKIDWYDYDWDYDFHSEEILAMDELTGIMSVIPGYEPNIMDAGFPSFNDTRLTQYQFANKLSISFTRWKLKYSSDEWPYITNMSWAFSNNQDSNYKYREYPSSYLQQAGFAYINDKLAYDLIFPLGTDKDKYDKINSRSASKYKAIMDNYCLNWFDVITDRNIANTIDEINWVDVNNGYAYFNSVLYNLNAIYNKMQYPDKVDKIDKFAVLVYPNTTDHIYEEDFIKEEITFVGNVIEYSDGGSEATVAVNSEIFNNILTDTPNYTLYEQDSDFNAGLKFDQLFVEVKDEENYDGTKYVNAHDLGIEYHDLNAYVKVRDVFGNSAEDDTIGIYTASNWKYTAPGEGTDDLTRNTVYKFGDTEEFFTSLEEAIDIKPNQYLNDPSYIKRRNEFVKTLYKLFTGESLSSAPDDFFDPENEYINDFINDFIRIIDTKIKEIFGEGVNLNFITNDTLSNTKTTEQQFKAIIDAFVCASFTDIDSNIYLPTDVFTENLGFKAYEQLNVYKGTLLTNSGSEINQHLVDYSVNLQYVLPNKVADGAQPNELPPINDPNYYVEQFTRLSPLYINSSTNIFVPELLGSKPTVVLTADNKIEFDIKHVVIPNTEEISNTYANMLYLYDWFINAEKYSKDYKGMYEDIAAILGPDKEKVKFILDQDILNNFIRTDNNSYGLPYLTEIIPNYTKSLFYNMEMIYAAIYETIKEKILEALSQTYNREKNLPVQHTELYLYQPLLNYNRKEVGRNVMIKKGLRFDECTDDTIYADEFNDYAIDDDVLYVHPYNVHNLLELIYGENSTELSNRDEFLKYIKTSTLYGKVVDMTYLKKMSNISASEFNNKFGKVGIPFNRSFYEQYKIFETDEDGNMTVRYLYVNFKDIMKRESDTYFTDDDALRRYIEQVNVYDDPEKGAFCREFNEYKKETDGTEIKYVLKHTKKVYFNIVEKTDYIKLDENLWELANITGNDRKRIYSLLNNIEDNEYVDLFIYRPIKDIEFDQKYNNIFSTAYIGGDLTYYNQVIAYTDNEGVNVYLKDIIDDLRLNANDELDPKYKTYINNLLNYSRPTAFNKFNDYFSDDYSDEISYQSICEDTDTMLYPCFNSTFIQDKEDTIFYKNYCLNNISKVTVKYEDGSEKNYYRYNENNAALFLSVTDEQYKELEDWAEAKGVNLKTYKKLHETSSVSYYTDNVEHANKYNDQYANFHMNTFNKDGMTYGYYIIDVDINNTSDLFDIRGLMDTDENSSNVAEIDQIQNLKYITYINGIDITTNAGKKYLQTIFKQLCPFLYINILAITSQIQTMMSPTAFNLTTTYASKQTDTANGSTERTLVYNKQTITSAKKQILQRYTNAVVPFIKKCNIINNQYNYKFKDMNVSLIDTGKFNSLGDSVIYKSNKLIGEKSSYNIYGFTDEPNKHSYNNIIYTYTPLEHKDYNRSEMINLPLNISIKADRPYAYHELQEAESNEQCIKVFKEYISAIRTFENNDQILFLYNKYGVSFKTSAIGVSFDNTEKIYTLEYKFNLL